MPRLTAARYEENFPGSDYTDEEREFLQAIDRYKHTYDRPFPTWREVLRVAEALGYRKVAAPRPIRLLMTPKREVPPPPPTSPTPPG
jgi:hypothetical protein